MKKLHLFAIASIGLLWQFNIVMAQTCTSVRNGNASNAMTWGGTPPGSCSNFIIQHLVTFNGSFTINNGSITVNGPNGVLVLGGGVDLELVNSTITINSGGTINLNGDMTLDNSALIINTGGTLGGSGTIMAGAFTYQGQTGGFNTIVNAGGLSTSGALPIELAVFTGKRIDQSIHLYWRTISENNNQYVEVQRSKDGKNFEPLRRVPGKTGGNSDVPLDYSIVDEQPMPGINYYRLRQVDFDEKENLHKVIAVLFKEEKAQGIIIFPTIVKHQLNIALSEEADTDGELYINDLNGRIMLHRSFERGMQQETLR